MTLGEQIKQAREQKNLSQEDLALQLEVSRQAISKWENDQAVPQGINRQLLAQVLELDLAPSDTQVLPRPSISRLGWLGWIIAGILLFLLLTVTFIHILTAQRPSETTDTSLPVETREEAVVTDEIPEPAITRITFYDGDQNEVIEEALWYDASRIESILVQWEGDAPDNIKLFATPSGSDTLDKTKLLLTKPVLDGDTVELLDGDILKTGFQNHVFLQLDFGETVITSDTYNVFYFEE